VVVLSFSGSRPQTFGIHMDREEIQMIEQELEIKLPASYCEAVLNYPFLEDAGTFNWSLGDDPSAVIRWTKRYRLGFSINPPWPVSLICIGEEGDGCPIALDLESERILKIDRGNPSKPPMETYPTFAIFMAECIASWREGGWELIEEPAEQNVAGQSATRPESK